MVPLVTDSKKKQTEKQKREGGNPVKKKQMGVRERGRWTV